MSPNGSYNHRGRPGEPGSHAQANQPGPQAAADPPRGNGKAMSTATLESRLEELRVLRSFSRPRVSNDNPYSESLFRTAKYRPD